MRKKTLLLIGLFAFQGLCFTKLLAQKDKYYAPFTSIAPVVDGINTDVCWESAAWETFKYELFGNPFPSATDFSGKFKVVWDETQIYILVEIVDDILNSDNPPLSDYWKDDCLEVFIDEDHSGGRHEVASWISGECDQCAYNAFAYHTDAVTFDAVDLGSDGQPHTFNNNCKAVVKKDGTNYTWEFAIKQFGPEFSLSGSNSSKILSVGKTLGFCMAYCDNDAKSDERENFIGTQKGAADAWINADLFGELVLLSCNAWITEQTDNSGNITGLKASSLPATNYKWNHVTSENETFISGDSILTNYSGGTYRLIVSNDACIDSFLYISSTGIEQFSNALKDISVFPNPAKNQLSVSANSTISALSFYNEAGHLVLFETYQLPDTKVVISDISLPGGIYILNVKTNIKSYAQKVLLDF